jgi:RNA recognition motif-containing protein
MRRASPGNLFIANLPPKMQAEELAALFDAFGHVLSARLAHDTQSGASRGYGFVDLAPAAAVDWAIEQLNGSRIGDRAIVVGRTRPTRPARPFVVVYKSRTRRG